MKVFISWAGERSALVAEALRDWLPYIFQNIEPWLSRSDIDAGSRWGREIENELDETKFGVLCLTRENVDRPWINFEAGAIAKAIVESSVVPFCLGFSPGDLPRGPLTLFQGVSADQDGTWRLVQALHIASADSRPEDRLRIVFQRFWPDLAEKLAAVPETEESKPQRRQTEDILSELLEIVRGLDRRASAGGALQSIPLIDAAHLWAIASQDDRAGIFTDQRQQLLRQWARQHLQTGEQETVREIVDRLIATMYWTENLPHLLTPEKPRGDTPGSGDPSSDNGKG